MIEIKKWQERIPSDDRQYPCLFNESAMIQEINELRRENGDLRREVLAYSVTVDNQRDEINELARMLSDERNLSEALTLDVLTLKREKEELEHSI